MRVLLFFNDTATTEIYTLSLHDALPIWTIIFLAAIAGVDLSRYEAAVMDGASRMRQIWHITLPAMRPTILILLIRSEEHTSELQSPDHLVCRLLLEKQKLATSSHSDTCN